MSLTCHCCNGCFCSFLWRMLVQRNLARTTQPARPVLQTEITSVCVFAGLLAMTVKTVLTHSLVIRGLTQLSNAENFEGLKYQEWEVITGSCNYKSWFSVLLSLLLMVVQNIYFQDYNLFKIQQLELLHVLGILIISPLS